MNAVNTNVLIYAHDSRERAKQPIALNLVNSSVDFVLLWQVVCEFLAASRKLKPIGFDLEQAFVELRKLQVAWIFTLPTPTVLDRAEELISRFSLSFWDAMIIGGSLEAGASILYSEDFSAYPNIDGMEIINPFKAL
ncbi:MAG: PIN domain-containing protein [Planctomycetaceae bacterium]